MAAKFEAYNSFIKFISRNINKPKYFSKKTTNKPATEKQLNHSVISLYLSKSFLDILSI